MKKLLVIFSLVFATACLMSCRSQKQACAAYSQVERPMHPDATI